MTDFHEQPACCRRRTLILACLVTLVLFIVGRCVWQRARQMAADLAIVNAFFGGGNREVESLAFAPDGEKLLAGYNAPGVVCLWDVARGSELHVVNEEQHGEDLASHLTIDAVAFAPDGQHYAVGTHRSSVDGWKEEGIRIRDTSTGKLIRTIDGASAQGLRFSPDWQLFVIVNRVFETRTGKQVGEFSLPENFYAQGVDFNTEGSLLAVSGYINGGKSHPSPIAIVFEMSTGRVVAKLDCPVERDHLQCWDIRDCSFSPDGKLLAIGTVGDEFYVWNLENNDVKVMRRVGGRWWAVEFSPDGKLLAVSGAGGTVLIWDVKNQREISALTGHLNSVYDLEFSPKGNLLASGGMDGRVRLWGPRRSGTTGWKLVRSLNLKAP